MKIREVYPELKKEHIRSSLTKDMEELHGVDWFEHFLDSENRDDLRISAGYAPFVVSKAT